MELQKPHKSSDGVKQEEAPVNDFGQLPDARLISSTE
jgi:hypothetical protein